MPPSCLSALKELLGDRFGIRARCYVKYVPSIAAEGALLDEIARDCDAVVIAGFD
jgi:hypothetical protein